MQITVADNVQQTMASALQSALERSRDVKIAVAFLSRSGLDRVGPSLQKVLQTGGSVEFLVGMDAAITEPQALWHLYEMSQGSKVALYCYTDPAAASLYHPKLYLMRNDADVVAIVGSSNLTQGGLEDNVEVNVVIEATLEAEIVSDLYGVYNRLKFDPHRVEPDREFLELYEALCAGRKRGSRQGGQADQDLTRAFREKARLLRRPSPLADDLVGWLKLVYTHLPDGEFTNQDLYAQEAVFRQHYPANRNVRAKVRQQLQILRDMGLVEHLGPSRWRKTTWSERL